MKNKKKTAKNDLKRFPAVVPVTSRDNTGTTARQPNLRAIMKHRVVILNRRRDRDQAEIMRLNAAISALGKYGK